MKQESMMKKFYGPSGLVKKEDRSKLDAALLEGVKAFQHCRYQESDTLADWRAFYLTVKGIMGA